jgi:hypothetical protein
MRRFCRRRRRDLCLVRLQCLISSSHLQGLLHHHLYCWTMEIMIQMTCLQFKRDCLILKLSFVWHFIFFCNFYKYDCIFLLGQNTLSGTIPPFQHCLWENVSTNIMSTNVTSTNIAGLRTIYSVTSGDDCIMLQIDQLMRQNPAFWICFDMTQCKYISTE